MLPVAILAGGLGTRLGSTTQSLPKVLVSVAGRPFVLRQLDYLSMQGVQHVVLCTGHRTKQVEAIVGDGSICGLQVQYSWDGESLLGTGGAIHKALPMLGNEFFVLYGDSFLSVNLCSMEAAYHACNRPALMTVYRNAGRWGISNVLFQDQRLIEYNKLSPRPEMQYIDCGLSILSASIFNYKRLEFPFDLATIYYQLSTRDRLAGYEVANRFYEIGSRKGLGEADKYFRMIS
jgi:NDP-sugar pyrophosphorylase family protein